MTPPVQYLKHSHCTYCGYPFEDQQTWPRRCRRCQKRTYRNSLPVAVILVPAELGLVTIRRRRAPEAGKLALPGGFVEVGETWQEAGVREVYEEAGLELDATTIRDFQVRSAPDETILIFGLAPQQMAEELPTFRPTEEVSERKIIYQPTPLAFPLHTAAVRDYFARLSDSTRSSFP